MEELPQLDGVTNFRELGGLRTRDGRRVRTRALFRSSHWGRASDADVGIQAQLGIGVVLDFRSAHDIDLEGPDRLAPGVECIALPTGDPASANDVRTLIKEGNLETLHEHFGGDRAHAYMRQGAAAMVKERNDSFAGFLQHLAKPDCPAALFHCSAGKDRAGWAASCVLIALGVELDDVIDHYLVSNDTYDPFKQGVWSDKNAELAALLEPLAKVRPEYAEASIAAACEEWGDLDHYFRDGLGLTDAMREQLRRNWLEG